MGDLVVLPVTVKVRSCMDCVNVMLGPRGTYCSLFHEFIWNEVTEATECEAYDE